MEFLYEQSTSQSFTTFKKHGDLDQRFEESIKRIMIDIGSEATQVLSDFYIKTSELQRSVNKAVQAKQVLN